MTKWKRIFCVTKLKVSDRIWRNFHFVKFEQLTVVGVTDIISTVIDRVKSLLVTIEELEDRLMYQHRRLVEKLESARKADRGRMKDKFTSWEKALKRLGVSK